jgi:hypothetical protein
MAAVNLGPWPAGMNNVAPDHALPTSKYGRTVAVRNAVNADIDSEGWLRRRAGYTKILAGANTRGGYACAAGTYFVQGSKLYRLNTDNSKTELCDGILGDEITYEHFNGVVYFSDGLVTKRITAAGAGEWGLDVPAAPTVYAVTGALPPGTYVAAITTVDADGRESGASETAAITLNVASGIRIAGLPSGKNARLYLSTNNGTTPFMVATTGADSYDITLPGYDSGKPLDTQFMTKPPAGRIIRHFNGRFYIADALGTVWFTEPYASDLVHRARGFFQFTAPVAVMEPGESGMWFVAETTEFYAGGGPEDFKVSQKLGYGAIYGTSQVLPRTQDAIWYSAKGVVMGTKDGQAENLQEKNVAADSGTSGASLIREQDGIRQMVVSVRDPNVSPLAATSFLEMEVIRKAAQ